MSGDDDLALHWDRHTVIEIEYGGLPLPVLAILTGIPVVDLSIAYEPHLVRGTE